MPPKLITKLANITPSLTLLKVDKLKQPFVISITPCKKYATSFGNKEKIGEKHSIITKNMAIIAPTESMDKVEERTMSDKLNFFYIFNFLLFHFNFFVNYSVY